MSEEEGSSTKPGNSTKKRKTSEKGAEATNKIVKFNVGGTRYEVARSLFEMHPDTMLARMVSEQWQENPEAEIFIERDGSRFQYVLDYLRDGRAYIPFALPKESLADDMTYYAISFETERILYSEGGSYAAARFIRKKTEMLDNEEKKAERRVEMLQFAKECFTRMVDDAQLGNSPGHWIVRSYGNEVKLYRLSRRMNLYIDDDPSGKDELWGICRQCGFVPRSFEECVHSKTVTIKFDYCEE